MKDFAYLYVEIIETHKVMEKTYYQMIKELKGYEPNDSHFTSFEEMEMLNKHFGLDKMSAFELQNLRDMFMLVYIGNKDMFTSCSMMSVTAVIDHYKWQKGGEI